MGLQVNEPACPILLYYILQPKHIQLVPIFPTFSNERQSGTCISVIYPFYAHITVRACTYMFMLEFQLVIPYHNRHTHCPRLSPYVMSDLEMVYIQHGTVRDSHM